MKAYKCMFKTAEVADSAAFYKEFEQVCSTELTPAYSGSDAWTGVRVFDLRGTNRLSELPYLRAQLEKIGMKNIAMVNYYNMAPHSEQHAHRDQSGNLLFGISRLHIPLKTNPLAFLEIEHIRYHLKLNEVWALDTSGLHAAQNESDEGRVHLVIDVKRSPETEKYFPEMTFAVRLHLAKFILIMGFKVVRDIITKPATIMDRMTYIVKMMTKSKT
jgi:Aspartyl/Asparaginyl beta-hydroxylase.